jgi:alkanesulfonate monooxygenase SsuD/methylene tetrahydromethanopterin reductase-like flavin-dependent oxidoreductase (luciferase family)
MTTLGRWAAESERAGFAAVGVIDRLVYANLDPLIALAVTAGRTKRIDLATTVLSIGWRNNPILAAKQLASLDLASGGRLWRGSGWVAGRRTTSPATFRRPALLFGGPVPAAYRRAAAHGQGWVAPLFGCPCSSRERRPSRRRGPRRDDRGSHGS